MTEGFDFRVCFLVQSAFLPSHLKAAIPGLGPRRAGACSIYLGRILLS